MTEEKRSAAQRRIRSEALARAQSEGGPPARAALQRRLVSEVMAEAIFEAARAAGLLLLDDDGPQFVRAALPVLERGRPALHHGTDGTITVTWVWEDG